MHFNAHRFFSRFSFCNCAEPVMQRWWRKDGKYRKVVRRCPFLSQKGVVLFLTGKLPVASIRRKALHEDDKQLEHHEVRHHVRFKVLNRDSEKNSSRKMPTRMVCSRRPTLFDRGNYTSSASILKSLGDWLFKSEKIGLSLKICPLSWRSRWLLHRWMYCRQESVCSVAVHFISKVQKRLDMWKAAKHEDVEILMMKNMIRGKM